MKYSKELQNKGTLRSALQNFSAVMMQENKLYISAAKELKKVTTIHAVHIHNVYNLGAGG